MTFGNIDLTPQLVQAVRDAVEIVDVASTQTRLAKKGRRYEGLCPLHKEKTPSFSVDPDRGLFYCFGCGTGGDAIKLHMLLTGDDFPAAIEALALRYAIPVPARPARRGRRGAGAEGEEADVDGALAAAAEFFRDQLARSPQPRAYLEERRIPPELIDRFALGYAPDDWGGLLAALRGRVAVADLLAAGLVGKSAKSGDLYDRFRHRLIFPIHNAAGRLVGFGGRTLGDDKAKYVNTAETDRFHKGTLLYGLYQARREIREAGRAVLVEGYFDVLAVVAAGLPVAVASMGTALTVEQARLLARYGEEVVVGYDGDRAGEEAHRRALPILLGQGLAVFRAGFGDGHDPDSLRLAAGEAAVARAVDRAPDAVIAEIERLTPDGTAGDPRRQARAAHELAALLKPVPDAVLRFGYARRAAQRLDLPVEILLKQLGAPPAGPPGTAAGRGAERPQAGALAPSLVRSLEEQVIHHLLTTPAALPAAAELPPEEVFFDPVCRNIYRAYFALYGRHGGAPDAHQVLAEVSGDDAAVDRIALVLLEESFASKGAGLPDSILRLLRRWHQKRLRELSREIHEAQRGGDEARLERLLNEKNELSRHLHGVTARSEP